MLGLAACRVAAVDFTGKTCPCPDGWSCEPSTQTCTRGELTADAPTGDAPADVASTGELHFWYHLYESSGSVVHDSSGVGGDGNANVDTIWYPLGGKVGGALHVGGAGLGATATMGFPSPCPMTPPAWTASISIAAWLRFDSFQTAPPTGTLGDFAVVQGSSGGNGGAWGVGATDKCGAETIGFELAPPTGTRAILCGTTVLAAGNWYHVVAVFDGEAMAASVYVDGVEESGTLIGTVPSQLATPGACPKGGGPTNGYNFMTGTIDELRIYDDALTPEQVTSIYQSGG